VAGVIVNRTQQETPDAAAVRRAEVDTVAIVIEAAQRLLA